MNIIGCMIMYIIVHFILNCNRSSCHIRGFDLKKLHSKGFHEIKNTYVIGVVGTLCHCSHIFHSVTGIPVPIFIN